jgi:CheY-like chemotaxis protein/HPt (histidine-containing phosphotransfer) domain-containing protein
MRDWKPQCEFPIVLLIDDDMVSREVTATLLTLNGYTVHTAEGGEAALKLVDEGQCQPGAILCDAQMPGLSGVELMGELRVRCKGAAIYLISGSQPAAALVAAADGVLLKPFDGEMLWNQLQKIPERRQESVLNVDEPVVSIKVLNKLREMMPEDLVRNIYSAMVADLDTRIEALGAAIARHDGDEVRRIGHSIKGGCGMAGAMQAARLGAMLEAEPMGQDNQLDNIRGLLADLRDAALGLHRILENELPA